MVIFQRRISKLDNLQAQNGCQPIPVYMPYIGRSESLPESTPGLACDVCRVESAEGVSISCLSVERAKTDEVKNVLFYMQGRPNNLTWHRHADVLYRQRSNSSSSTAAVFKALGPIRFARSHLCACAEILLDFHTPSVPGTERKQPCH